MKRLLDEFDWLQKPFHREDARNARKFKTFAPFAPSR
jgi:hypothetical protein